MTSTTASSTTASSSMLWRFPLVALFAAFGALTFLDAGVRAGEGRALADGLARLGLARGLAERAAGPAVYLGAALELGGAAALVQHGGERCGAAMLAAFLLLVTPIAHWPFDKSGALSHDQLAHALKNLALLGGLWLAWNVGCDVVAEKRAKKAEAAAKGH